VRKLDLAKVQENMLVSSKFILFKVP
jgi:hypothetical protein